MRSSAGYEAARLHTAGAARLTGDAKIRGTLAPGKLADFTGWPTDPLSCPVEELAGLLPVLTVVGGRVRHHVHGLTVRGGILRPVAISS